jgi:hypothetical protein
MSKQPFTIHELWRAVTMHPDYAGGTLYCLADLAYCLSKEEAEVTDRERRLAIKMNEELPSSWDLELHDYVTLYADDDPA